MISRRMKISSILSRRNRILLRELVVTDFKLRYQGSVLGYLWSLLKPLFLFAVLYVVFVNFLRFGSDIEHFPVYLLLGMVMWTFFIEATSQGMQALVARGDLIRKINLPKYIIVVSGTISALINMIFNLLVVSVFLVVNGVEFRWSALLFPLSILELYIFALAIAFLLSAAYVRFRDTNHIWEVMLQVAFYATPILYPISMVIKESELAAKIMLLNPIAQIIQDARYSLVTPQTTTVYSLLQNPLHIAIPFVIVVVVTLVSIWYFKRNQKTFAENV